METSSFVTSLATSFLIFVVLLILHSIFSRIRVNEVIYYPGKKFKNVPNYKQPGLFGWLREAWSVSEDEIIKQAGLDAAIYMIFLGSAFSICLYTAIFCVPILLPVSITDRNFQLQRARNSSVGSSDFDKVAMGNVMDGSKRLWAYVIGAYWLTIVTMHRLWKTYKHVVQLRSVDQSNPQKVKVEQYAVLVRDIPAPQPGTGTMYDQVDKYFKALHPETYRACVIVTKTSNAAKLWRQRQEFRRNLARAMVYYEKKKMEPTHRTGFLGLFGPREKSIDFYRREKEVKERALVTERKSVTFSVSQKGAAIIIFSTRAAANSASQSMHSLYANQWTTCPAPDPKAVIWGNLAIPFVQRLIRQTIVYFVVTLMILFYMIPIAFISALISLDNLKKKLPFLKPLMEMPLVNTALQAYLPQLVLLVFIFLLPSLLLKLSSFEGIPSKAIRDRAAAGKFFYFNVFNIFLGVTIVGSLFTSLKGLIDNPQSIIALLSESLPGQASFFISFVALRFFVGYGLVFARIVSLIKFRIRKRFHCKTEEDVQEAWAPKCFKYAIRVPGDMLILTITFSYAVIAPLILVFAIVYFGLGWLFMRNLALNVIVPKYESGGRMWPHIHSRIVGSLFLSQLTMLGYFGVKKFVYVPLLFPPLVATIVFAYICRKFFYPSFDVTPLYATCEEPPNRPSVEDIQRAYTPSYLSDHIARDDEEMARRFQDMIEDED